MALVSGAGFCALAGVGVTYVVTAGPSETTLTQAPPSPTTAPAPSVSPAPLVPPPHPGVRLSAPRPPAV